MGGMLRLDAALTAGRDPGLPHGTTAPPPVTPAVAAVPPAKSPAAMQLRDVDPGNAAPIEAP